MSTPAPILERWIASTMASYPGVAASFLAGEADRFRNPVGYTLREGLATLLEELLGDMDVERIRAALDALIRIRAVQDLTASEATQFVLQLRPLLRELAPDLDQVLLSDRIDRVALMAFDKYTQCREQLAEIRANEGRRNIRMRQVVG